MEYGDVDNVKEPPKKKPLFEFEGKYEDDKQYFDDDNVNNAVELRENRQRHSDFFFKLHELKERIDVYNAVYRSKIPRYLRGDTIKVIIEYNLIEVTTLKRIVKINTVGFREQYST